MLKQIVILKLGSTVLTNEKKEISSDKLVDLAIQISKLKEKYNFILVSSGAIATARQHVSGTNWNDQLVSKQALAAIGQPKLIQQYYEIFKQYELNIAQCLLTYNDIDSKESGKNTYNTIIELVQHGYIPIINENDTVAIDEILMGDNDKLSAKLAVLLKVDLLILATDINGIYNKNPHLYPDAVLIKEIRTGESLIEYVEEKSNTIGRGGMTSKIEAAQMCLAHKIPSMIVNGKQSNFIIDSMDNKLPCSRFIV